MLKKSFKKLFKVLKNGSIKFDPSCFNDSIATQTCWESNSCYDSEIRHNKLLKVNAHRLEFRSTFDSKIPFYIFFLFGVAFAWLMFINDKLLLVGILIPLIFIIMSCIFLYFLSIPVVFDSSTGCFWKGWKQPTKHYSKLDSIHALQIICRNYVDDTGYELNLIMKNGNRINVGSYSNKNKVREDTADLAVFLKKQIWDAI